MPIGEFTRVCPRCGTEAGDSRWCSGCGLNLGIQYDLPINEEGEDSHEDTPPLTAREAKRVQKWLMVGGVIAVALVAVLVAAWRIKSIDIPLVSESHSSPTPAGDSPPGVIGTPVAQRCLTLWNSGRIPEFGGRQQLANRVLLTTEGEAFVTTDRQGICLVAFPESAGSEPGGGGGAALTFSFERGAWGLYLLIGHKSAPVNPAVAEEQRGSVNEREGLMQGLEGQVETEPNARLDHEGYLALLDTGTGESIRAGSEGSEDLATKLVEAAEAGRHVELESGVKREIKDIRTSGEDWAAATLILRFPGQGPDRATGVFQRIGGNWTLFEVGSSFAGATHCPPPSVSTELELECG